MTIVVNWLFSAGGAVGTSEVTATPMAAVVLPGAAAGEATAAMGAATAAAASTPRMNFFMVFVSLLVTVVVTHRHHDTTPLTVPEWVKELEVGPNDLCVRLSSAAATRFVVTRGSSSPASGLVASTVLEEGAVLARGGAIGSTMPAR